ncbi:ATP synthase F1 subunit gamma [Mycoplasma marinum]|uniref:ATP synthase gamma chain n=1 Tax=Mycoplasma marinum TaxID=1937190 RepID=A0A4R0XT12_9MOLU|nr:ATP synthase F1 subunit gamma [Mycoplasma marinum]TCG12033.1 F0F1 ATP synthase subunit gamma [Mycoplasma marinum]
MASLQETKSRLQSIGTTKKITKAMQLVATAKLRKAKSNLESIQEYYTAVYETFQKLLNSVSDVKKLFPQNAEESTLYIVITSDLGLCGGYNSNVLKMLKADWKKSDKVIILGNKGISHLKAIGKQAFKEYSSVGDEPNYDYASGVGQEAIAQFLSGKINKVKLIHTKFINSVTFEAKTTQLLPIEKPEGVENSSNGISAVTEFEPSPEVVLKKSIPLYVSAMIFGSMVESKVSEMSSRRTAMENATDNANELIKKLDLEYNRARQAAITQEISEIVGGSEAQ